MERGNNRALWYYTWLWKYIMGLMKKEDVVNMKILDYKDVSKIIDKFLEWGIIPSIILNSLTHKIVVSSPIKGLDYFIQEIENIIPYTKINLDYKAYKIWKEFNKAQRYSVLLEMLTSNLKVEAIERLLKDIFWKEYHPFMADIILNNMDEEGNFTFITKE